MLDFLSFVYNTEREREENESETLGVGYIYCFSVKFYIYANLFLFFSRPFVIKYIYFIFSASFCFSLIFRRLSMQASDSLLLYTYSNVYNMNRIIYKSSSDLYHPSSTLVDALSTRNSPFSDIAHLYYSLSHATSQLYTYTARERESFDRPWSRPRANTCIHIHTHIDTALCALAAPDHYTAVGIYRGALALYTYIYIFFFLAVRSRLWETSASFI